MSTIVISWFCVVCGMSALEDIVLFANSVTETITSLVVVPLLIFFSAVIVGRLLRVLLFAFLRSVEFDKHMFGVLRYRAQYAETVSRSLAGIVYAVGVVWALVEAGIIVVVLQVVGVFLGVLALVALVVWLVDFLPNFFSYFGVVKKYAVGDELSVSGVSGTVQNVGWLAVTVVTSEGFTVVIPHRTVRS